MCGTSKVCYTSKAIGPKAHNKTQYTLTGVVLKVKECQGSLSGEVAELGKASH